MFKAGDRVRVLRHRNYLGEDIPGYGIPSGTIITLGAQRHELSGDGFDMFATEDTGDSYSWIIRSDDIELVNDRPVREVTRREIVPGVYGIVNVGRTAASFVKVPVGIEYLFYTAEELREAAHVLNQIAEALEDV